MAIVFAKIREKKNYDLHSLNVFLHTFSKGDGRADIEQNNSNDTFVCDGDAHIVVLCTRSYFS